MSFPENFPPRGFDNTLARIEAGHGGLGKKLGPGPFGLAPKPVIENVPPDGARRAAGGERLLVDQLAFAAEGETGQLTVRQRRETFRETKFFPRRPTPPG